MYEGIIQELIDELGRLPGIGPKSAQRIAFHIVQSERVDVNRLVEVLRLVKEKVKFCSQCFNVAVDGLLEALDKIRRGEYTDAGSGQPASYFSWPTAEEWRMFRQQGGRII